MTVSEWFSTAGGNSPAENCSPAVINDEIRSVRADVRSYANDAAWFSYGNGTGTPDYTRISGTSFSVTTDVTAAYHVGRRVRATGTSTGTIHGTIATSAYSSVTTVTVAWDSGSLAAETITVYLYILPLTGAKEARTDVANSFVPAQTFAGAATFVGDVTMDNLEVTGIFTREGVPVDPPEFGTAALVNLGTSGATVPLLSTSCTWGSGTTQTFGTINVTTLKQSGTTYTLGTAATKNSGTSGATVPLMNASNTWSGNQFFNYINTTNANFTNLVGTNIDVVSLLVGGVYRNNASTTVAGLMEAATAAETLAGSDTARAITPNSFAINGASTNPGYQRFPGGRIFSFGVGTTNASGVATVTYAVGYSNYAAPVCTVSNSSHRNIVLTSSNNSGFSVLITDANGTSAGSLVFSWLAMGF